MDFDHAVKDFCADLELAGRQDSTIRKHDQALQHFGRWCASERLVWHDLHQKQLRIYLRTRKGLSASATGNMFCSLRTFFQWAIDQEHIAVSPATNLKTPRRATPLPKALNLDDVRQLVNHLGDQTGHTARRNEALILTALYTGLRAKELATLCWNAVDLRAGVIGIHLSKMNHGRAVPIHADLSSVLERWKESNGGSDTSAVFTMSGQITTSNRVGKIMQQVRAASGVQFTAHTLRHTFATWALRNSHDLYAVSKALGHQQLAQTEIYVSADIAMLKSAVQSLPALGDW